MIKITVKYSHKKWGVTPEILDTLIQKRVSVVRESLEADER